MVRIKGSKAIMEAFRCEGVEYVFGLPGSTELTFLSALEDCPDITYILTLHEAVTVAMAEGYARVSNKVGVVNLHTCAGLAAGMPALLNARAGGVPLLVTAGQQDSRLFMQDPHLAGDLVGLASHFTKWSAEIIHGADIPLTIRRAFKLATQLPTGPVFVSLPQDIMEADVDFAYTPAANPFNGLRPDRQAVELAADLIAHAESPAIIVESGVARSDALSETVLLAELTGAPVYQHWVADANFPNQHCQYRGTFHPEGARQLLESVDVLIVIGAPLFAMSRFTPESPLSPRTKIVQIDDNPWEIAKNYPVAAGLCGHIKVSLAELTDAIEKTMTSAAKKAAKARARSLAAEKASVAKAFAEKGQREWDQIPIAISRLAQELAQVVTPDTVVIDEACSSSEVLLHYLSFAKPLSYNGSRGGGSIGWGMPAAIGAKLAAPSRPVLALVGDGAAIWSIQSLWTAARYGVPVTYVIFANGAYTTLKKAKKGRLGPQEQHKKLWLDLDSPRLDFCGIAQAMGVAAQRVERPQDLGAALKQACASDSPSLVEVSVADES